MFILFDQMQYIICFTLCPVLWNPHVFYTWIDKLANFTKYKSQRAEPISLQGLYYSISGWRDTPVVVQLVYPKKFLCLHMYVDQSTLLNCTIQYLLLHISMSKDYYIFDMWMWTTLIGIMAPCFAYLANTHIFTYLHNIYINIIR